MDKSFSAFDYLPIGCAVTDVDFVIRFWNIRMEAWTGWKKEDMIGCSLLEKFPRLQMKHYQSRLSLFLETHIPMVFVHQLNGTLFPHRENKKYNTIHHVTVTWFEMFQQEPLILFSVEDRTELSQRIQLARREELELQRTIKEKEYLMQEMNHRIKNNLNMIRSLISLQKDIVEDQQFQQYLEDIEGRVLSFAKLHEILSKNTVVDTIHLGSYVTDLANELFASLVNTQSRAELHIHTDDLEVSSKIAVSMGLIITEALLNAIKYGIGNRNEGQIILSLKTYELEEHSHKVCITISDDGPGFSDPDNPFHSNSLGLGLIEMFATQLKGEFKRYNKNGAVVEIGFTING